MTEPRVCVTCPRSTWVPLGDYVASNTDECTATLMYAVSLKQSGTVSFEYIYPDSSIVFEFFVGAGGPWGHGGVPGDIGGPWGHGTSHAGPAGAERPVPAHGGGVALDADDGEGLGVPQCEWGGREVTQGVPWRSPQCPLCPPQGPLCPPQGEDAP